MTLVELMIAGAIMLVALLAVSQLMVTSLQQQRMIMSRMDYNSLITTIQISLSSSSSCKMQLEGQHFNPATSSTNPNELEFAQYMNPALKKGNLVSGWTIETFNAMPVPAFPPVDVTIGGVTYKSYIVEITFQAVDEKGNKLRPFKTPVQFIVNPAGNTIADCYTTSGVQQTSGPGWFQTGSMLVQYGTFNPGPGDTKGTVTFPKPFKAWTVPSVTMSNYVPGSTWDVQATLTLGAVGNGSFYYFCENLSNHDANGKAAITWMAVGLAP